jgi:hypothetical protein
MAQMLAALSELFEEDFVPGVESYLTQIDQAYAKVVASGEKVVQDELTKNYKAIHTFVTSVAGAVRPASALGPQMVSGTGATRMISAHDTYPGVSDVPLPGIDQRYITLGGLKGSVVLNRSIIRANKLPGTVDDYPSIVLKQFALNLAHQNAVSWFLPERGYAIIINADAAGVTTATGASTRSGHQVTVSHDDGAVYTSNTGQLRRILPGLQYDLWSYSGGSMATCYTKRGWCMVTGQIDQYGDSTGAELVLYFQSEQDAIDFAGTSFSTDLALVPYGAIADRDSAWNASTNPSTLPCGYKWWLKASGTIFGAWGDSTITATSHGSFFKSMVKAVSAALTETYLNKYVAQFEQATGVELDTIMLTPGILTNLLDSYGTDKILAGSGTTIAPITRPLGSATSVEMGWDKLGYRFNGRVFEIVQSAFLTPGEVVVLKTKGGNLVRYQPPVLEDATGGPAGFDPRIEWLGKETGPTIWMGSTAPGGGKTNGLEAPFDFLVQHAAREVRGIQFTGVTETTP